MRNHWTTILLLAMILSLGGCRQTAGPAGRREVAGAASPIAVASSYLAVAVRDVLGEDEPLVTLAEAGMCPGHFDLRPSQARRLRSCGLLVRFDFQESLDSRLSEDSARSPRVLAVTVAGGLCEPESYRSVCRQLAEALVRAERLSPDDAKRRLAAIDKRMDRLGRWTAGEVKNAGMNGTLVLASGHQAAFCRRLGLDVVATFSSVDTARPGQVDEAIRAGEAAGARLIVANAAEGRQLADALADRLGAKVVVFDNFPSGQGPRAFDALVRRNVTALVEASEP